jgi:hypothetical protein
MEKSDKNRCKCPYCDIPEPKSSPFCGGKDTKLRICSECGYVIPRTAKHCAVCGAEVKVVSKLKCD